MAPPRWRCYGPSTMATKAAHSAEELEDALLERGEVHLRVGRFERRHGSRAHPSVGRKSAILYDVATLTVRVQPRSARPGLDRRDGDVVVRVASPPVEGRATEEALRVVADHLGLPRSAVTLRSGVRARVKIFVIDGLTDEQIDARISVDRHER